MWNVVLKVVTVLLWISVALSYVYMYLVLVALLVHFSQAQAWLGVIYTVLLALLLTSTLLLQYYIEKIMASGKSGALFKIALYMSLQGQAPSIRSTGKTLLFRLRANDYTRKYMQERFRHPAQIIAELIGAIVLWTIFDAFAAILVAIYNYSYEKVFMKKA